MAATIYGLYLDLYWPLWAFAISLFFDGFKLGLSMATMMGLSAILRLFAGICIMIGGFGREILWIIAFVFFVCLVSKALSKKQGDINKAITGHGQWKYFLLVVVFHLPQLNFINQNMDDKSYIFDYGATIASESAVGVIILVLISLTVAFDYQRKTLIKLTNFNRKCLKEQEQQYKFLNERQKEISKLRHDMAGHIGAIAHLLEENKVDEVREYVETLKGGAEATRYVSTGNIIGDAVVNQYIAMGIERGVNVSSMGSFGDSLQATNTDLCIMLTNVVSNAFEAASACPSEKTVRIEFSIFKDMQFIIVTNTSLQPVNIENGILKPDTTTKKDKLLHGYGLENTIEAVNRSGGAITWSCSEEGKVSYITAEIQIHIGQEAEKKGDN